MTNFILKNCFLYKIKMTENLKFAVFESSRLTFWWFFLSTQNIFLSSNSISSSRLRVNIKIDVDLFSWNPFIQFQFSIFTYNEPHQHKKRRKWKTEAFNLHHNVGTKWVLGVWEELKFIKHFCSPSQAMRKMLSDSMNKFCTTGVLTWMLHIFGWF